MDTLSLLKSVGNGSLSADGIAAQVSFDEIDFDLILGSNLVDARKGLAAFLSQLPANRIPSNCVIHLLCDDEETVVSETLWALENKPSLAKRFLSKILKLTEHYCWNVRLAATTVLGDLAAADQLAFAPSVGIALHSLASDDIPAVRAESTRLLTCSGFGVSDRDRFLGQFCSDEDGDVRRHATAMIATLRPTWDLACELLTNALSDSSYDVRVAACQAAGKYTSEAGPLKASLVEQSKSSDKQLRDAASRALREIRPK